MPLRAALDLAHSLAQTPQIARHPDEHPRARRLVVGDPQAPLETFLTLFARRGLLTAEGRLSPEVLLVSIGDHFDWGRISERQAAARDGLALICWLAAHPPDQVVILAGNHDLGRVGELCDLDEPTWARAQARATAIYRATGTDPEQERAFLADFPMFPTAEVAARDFAAFSVEQRVVVRELLRAGRLRMAWAAARDLLTLHAGVTHRELEALGLPPSARGEAGAVAEALNAALDRAVTAWGEGPLTVPALHEPGSAATGEGGGALYHRAADPDLGAPADFEGPRRRRFDPRGLPHGLTQIIGHVRDHKSRSLMPAWADGAASEDGVLRHLRTDGRRVAYAHGLAGAAAGEGGLWFVDAGMNHVSPERYPLLDLDRRAAA